MNLITFRINPLNKLSLFTFHPIIILSLLLPSCISVQKTDSIDDGYYLIKNKIQPKGNTVDESSALHSKIKVYLEDYIDSLHIYDAKDSNSLPIVYKTNSTSKIRLVKNEFDIDLFVVPLKLRPSQQGFPVQLNTQFNTSLYFGYRKDFNKIIPASRYKFSIKRKILRNGFGAGGFIGISTVAMNPWVTQGTINSEYDGLAITYGISTIYAVQKFNAGLALGFDYLTDKNSKVWLYQNKPWIGVLVGLNLN